MKSPGKNNDNPHLYIKKIAEYRNRMVTLISTDCGKSSSEKQQTAA